VIARRASSLLFVSLLGSLGGLCAPSPGWAQEAPSPLPSPVPQAPSTAGRPGLLKLGPLYVTPFIRINSAGLDTNVFYTAADRRVDAMARGGPGLEIVLPAGDVRFLVDGGIDYLYFVRTKSQRHLGGGGRARLEWNPGRFRAAIEEGYARSFDRPGLEVDERILRDSWNTRGELALALPGRLGIHTAVNTVQRTVPEATTYRGTDLGRTLTQAEHRFLAGLSYRLTQKTSVLLEGDLQLDRFERDPLRDADSNRVYAGLAMVSPTRLAGRAVAGVRFFRPHEGGPLARETTPYVSADLTYRFRPRTALRTRYDRDLSFSAFDTTDGAPTLKNERMEAHLEKGLFGRFVIDIYGVYTRLRSDGAVTLTSGPGLSETRVRKDTAWSGGVDFGYQFRSRVRVGVAATYLDRQSNFRDLGIQGVLVGATVKYTPQN
jgi:hypothetical protein